jgi:hypothetical protein
MDFQSLVGPSIAFYDHFADEVGLPGWNIGIRHQGWLSVNSNSDGPNPFKAFVEANRKLGVQDTELVDRADVRGQFS